MDNFGLIKNYFKKVFKKLSLLKSFEFLYNKGIDYYNKEDYEKAINHFKLALEKPEIKPQVYYNLALSYQHLKAYELAIVSYKKFLELNPKDFDGLYNLALTYYTLENYEKATSYFEKCFAIKKDEDSVKALTLSYLANNEEQKALDLSEEVIKLPQIGIKLYYTIAKVFENKNSSTKEFAFIEKAIELYSKILDIDSQYFDSFLSMSICYAKKGEWENSVNFCKKALGANPKSFEANNQMGLVYYCCNEIEEAIKYYETAMKIKPEGDYKIYSNLAYAYEKAEQIPKAIKTFTQLINKFPNYPAKQEIKNHLRVLKTIHR